MTEWPLMGDAAFASNLDGTAFQAVAGYLASPNAFHAWTAADWAPIPGPKLPIYVANFNGLTDAESAVEQMQDLGVPKGCAVAYDMETRVDVSLVSAFNAVVNHFGYIAWVYGSASTVFGNPVCNGYWVADYTFTPFMFNHVATRATQFADGPLYDQSTIKPWEMENRLWR